MANVAEDATALNSEVNDLKSKESSIAYRRHNYTRGDDIKLCHTGHNGSFFVVTKSH